MRKVAIVEPAHSHEEVIFPQIELLRDTFEVHVVAPQSLLDVDLLSETTHLYQGHAFTKAQPKTGWRRIVSIPWQYWAMKRAVDGIAPDVVVFNSTYTLLECLLILLLFRRYRKVQIIHEFDKFIKGPGRWIYHGFDGNLVLSEQVHWHIRSAHPQFSDLAYFLPIFFGGFVSGPATSKAAAKPAGSMLRVGVFGSVNGKRRNYWGLLNAVLEMKHAGMICGFRVYLVGEAPRAVDEFIKQNGLEAAVECGCDFLPFRAMFSRLAEMDIVLFLVDREVEGVAAYNRYKITGTSSLVKAFRKASAVSSDFVVDASLAGMCYSYVGTDVGGLLRQVAAGEVTASDIQAKVQRFEGQRLFSFTEQQTGLVAFLERAMHAG